MAVWPYGAFKAAGDGVTGGPEDDNAVKAKLTRQGCVSPFFQCR